MRVLTSRAISASESRCRTSSIRLHEHLLLVIGLAKKPAVERRLQPLPRLERRGDRADQQEVQPARALCQDLATVRLGFETIETTSSAIGRTSSVRSAARANRY